MAANGGERDKLERLARYIARPPIATERPALTDSGHIRYTLKTPYRDGTTHVIFEPMDFSLRPGPRGPGAKAPGASHPIPWRVRAGERLAAAGRFETAPMLPRNPLGRKMYAKLKVFAGPEHTHEAQQPIPLEVNA